jgi:hypothetical protein
MSRSAGVEEHAGVFTRCSLLARMTSSACSADSAALREHVQKYQHVSRGVLPLPQFYVLPRAALNILANKAGKVVCS